MVVLMSCVFGVTKIPAQNSHAPAAPIRPQLTITQLTSYPACDSGGTFYPSIDGKGTKVAFTSSCDLVTGGNTDQNQELYVMNIDGTGLLQLTVSTGGIGVYNPSLGPNGQTIVFASDRDLVAGGNTDLNSEIFLVNVDGTGLTQLTHTTGGDPNNFGGNSHPRLDASGHWVTFSSDRDLLPGRNTDGNHELFLVRVDGTVLRQLTSTTGGYGVFSPGSLDSSDSKVIFDSDRDMVAGGNLDGNSDLFMMNVDGSNLVQLTNSTGGAGCLGPVWTPNTQRVTFWSDRDFVGNNADANYEVFRMNLDGSGLVQVTAGTGGFGAAPWGITSDGRNIAVESDRDLAPGGNSGLLPEIYLVRLVP
jgi:Tol biopolymer transport system component